VATCDTCGNEYDKTFTIERADTIGTFDSFECAIALMAPVCMHCGCRILGHGVEAEDGIYCCAHCARSTGHTELVDRA
jgi:Rieske Fe-S protein